MSETGETAEARLERLGIILPAAAAPAGNYRPFVLAGDTLYISGQLPRDAAGTLRIGRLGGGLSVEAGEEAARLCALHVLAQAKAALGDLGRIRQTLRVSGFVAATPDFAEHPRVVNGASDLLAEALGEAGLHTRIAVGVASLPGGAAVEVDAVFRVTPG